MGAPFFKSVMDRIAFFALLALACVGCGQPSAPIDTQKAADTWRYPTPDGVLSDAETARRLGVSLLTHYPVWRSELAVTVDVHFQNDTSSFVYARTIPRLFVYDKTARVPLFYSMVDLAFGESASEHLYSVISLPAGASKDLTISIRDLKFGDVSVKSAPDRLIYDLVPTGAYQMRFEMELYNEQGEVIGTLLSNFTEMTTIFTSPEAIPVKP